MNQQRAVRVHNTLAVVRGLVTFPLLYFMYKGFKDADENKKQEENEVTAAAAPANEPTTEEQKTRPAVVSKP